MKKSQKEIQTNQQHLNVVQIQCYVGRDVFLKTITVVWLLPKLLDVQTKPGCLTSKHRYNNWPTCSVEAVQRAH